MSTTLEDRFILILREQMSSADAKAAEEEQSLLVRFKIYRTRTKLTNLGMWEALDKLTGISGQRWRNAYNRRQRPTTDMIEAISQTWPQYAFWLSTGITDATNGHIAPMTALTFPERLYGESFASNQYFKRSLELARKLYSETKIDFSDDSQRLSVIERVRPLAHWVGNPETAGVAYKLASTSEYESLKTLWEERETDRTENLERITGKCRPWTNKTKADSLRQSPILGMDPKSQHQDPWDLFYTPDTKKNNGNKEN